MSSATGGILLLLNLVSFFCEAGKYLLPMRTAKITGGAKTTF